MMGSSDECKFSNKGMVIFRTFCHVQKSTNDHEIILFVAPDKILVNLQQPLKKSKCSTKLQSNL